MPREFEQVAELRNGCAIFRKPNGVGGHVYAIDEIGGGAIVWDTCLVDIYVLLKCIVLEQERIYKDNLERKEG